MKVLWAPWRFTYIKQLGEKEEDETCVLCKIIREKEEKDKENYVLYRGKYSYIVLNIYPYNTGHLMIVPYKHVPSITDLNDRELQEIFKLIKNSLNALKDAYNPDGFNIGANIGRDAGAGIHEHFHIHIVPRWRGDTNYMPIISDTKVISQALDDSYTLLQRALKKRLRKKKR